MSTIWAFNHIEKKHFIRQKILYENFLSIFKTTREKYDWFSKENNVTFNKKKLKSNQGAKVC